MVCFECVCSLVCLGSLATGKCHDSVHRTLYSSNCTVVREGNDAAIDRDEETASSIFAGAISRLFALFIRFSFLCPAVAEPRGVHPSAFFFSSEYTCTVRYAVTPTHFFLVVLRMVAVLLAVSLSSSEPSLIEILG